MLGTMHHIQDLFGRHRWLGVDHEIALTTDKPTNLCLYREDYLQRHGQVTRRLCFEYPEDRPCNEHGLHDTI